MTRNLHLVCPRGQGPPISCVIPRFHREFTGSWLLRCLENKSYSQLLTNLHRHDSTESRHPRFLSFHHPKSDPSQGRSRGKRKKSGLVFDRVFSDPEVRPFDQIEWESRTAEITDDSGKVIFKQENIEVPKSWSPLATKIAVSKYFYGDIANGTDPHRGGRETSVRQLIHRVTRTIADCGIADGYFADRKAAETFYDELTWLCVNQHGAFNSPVWFNVGLYHVYGIGQGRRRRAITFTIAAPARPNARTTQYEYPQGSACFIQSVDDTMEDIMRLATSEAMLFKYGSGTGTDLSSLRSTREKLSGGGKPSGPLSFLKVYDQVANVVKSRRQNAARREDEHAEGLASRHRGIHRGQDRRKRRKPGR